MFQILGPIRIYNTNILFQSNLKKYHILFSLVIHKIFRLHSVSTKYVL